MYNENFVKIIQTKEKYIFTVESTGVMKPLEIVRQSFKVLKEKLIELKTELGLSTIS